MLVHRRAFGWYLIVAALVCIWVSLALAGCTRAVSQRPVSNTLTLPLAEYFKVGPIRDTDTSSQSGALIFPVLDVFSPEGQLVYHAASLIEAREFLDTFIQHPQNLTPLPGRESWSNLVTRFPALATLDKAPPAYTFLVVELESCEACDLQANMLKKYEEQLSQISVKRQVIMLKR